MGRLIKCPNARRPCAFPSAQHTGVALTMEKFRPCPIPRDGFRGKAARVRWLTPYKIAQLIAQCHIRSGNCPPTYARYNLHLYSVLDCPDGIFTQTILTVASKQWRVHSRTLTGQPLFARLTDLQVRLRSIQDFYVTVPSVTSGYLCSGRAHKVTHSSVPKCVRLTDVHCFNPRLHARSC